MGIAGEGFPGEPWPLVLTLGHHPCVLDAVSRNATWLVCRTPPGAGWTAVAVATLLQISSTGTQQGVCYDAPVVDSVLTPDGRSIEGRFQVVVLGRVSSAVKRRRSHRRHSLTNCMIHD